MKIINRRGRMDMRYSRLRRSKSRRRYAAFLVTCVLVFTALYVFSAGAAGSLISKMIVPILDSSDSGHDAGASQEGVQGENFQETYLTVPETVTGKVSADKEIEKITDTLDIAPMALSAIQMGAFTNEENAKMLAREVQNRGGAGYIIEDKYFRVMAMGFMDENDAMEVVKQLKNQGIDSQIYRIVYSGVNIKITASPEKVKEIKSAFELWKEKMKLLEETIKELDGGKISTADALGQIKSAKEEFMVQLETLNGFSATGGNSTVLEELQQLYRRAVDDFDELCEKEDVDGVAISSKMKYTYVDMFYRFKQYIDKISQG